MSAERAKVERFVRGITLNGLTFEGEAVMDSLLNALCAAVRAEERAKIVKALPTQAQFQELLDTGDSGIVCHPRRPTQRRVLRGVLGPGEG